MGRPKWKYVFEHAQNAQIQIHPTHAQSLIRAFALHWYILLCPVILLADSEGPDQSDLGLRCLHMPEDTPSHGVVHSLQSNPGPFSCLILQVF